MWHAQVASKKNVWWTFMDLSSSFFEYDLSLFFIIIIYDFLTILFGHCWLG